MVGMESGCLLSIITINFNGGASLHRTLDAFRDFYTDPAIQMIFIDGGSRDGSADLARPCYAPGNFVSERDRGVYHAMNKGAALARGKYLLFLNSGDCIIPETRGSILDVLAASSHKLVSFATRILSEDGSRLESIFRPDVAALPTNTLPHPSTFFLASAFHAAGGYDERLRVAGDFDLILRMALPDRAAVACHDLAIANFYAGGMSGRVDYHAELIGIFHRAGYINRVEYLRQRLRHFLRRQLGPLRHRVRLLRDRMRASSRRP